MRPIPDALRPILAVLAMTVLAAPAAAQEPGPDVPNALRAQDRPGKAGWYAHHEHFLDRAKEGDIGLLFLGDSITEGWKSVPEVWNRFYKPRKAANFGIGGDQTGHVLWRLDHDEVKGISPKAVVLMIGTNNVHSDKPEDVARGIEAIVKSLREKLPESRILLLGVFPRGEKPSAPERDRLKNVNERISKLDDGAHVKYLDIGHVFLADDGTIPRAIMPDSLHLSPKGYLLWAEAMEPALKELTEGKSSGD